MSELLPCPFCECKPYKSNLVLPNKEDIVFCNNSECAIFKFGALKSRWNTRQSTIPISDAKVLVEALKGMSELCGNYFDESQLVCARDREIWKQHLDAITLAKQLNLTTEKGGDV